MSQNSSAVTDEELAVSALLDDAAFAELYRRYEPVARRMAGKAKAGLPSLDVGDATSLAMVKLWSGLSSFDPAQPFENWASVVLSRAVKTAVESARTAKRSMNWWGMLFRPDPSGAERQTPFDDVAEPRSSADEALLLTTEEALISTLLDDVLSDMEAKVMRLRLAGWNYEEVGVRLGLKPKAVDNAATRATRKLRRTFTDSRSLDLADRTEVSSS